MYYSPILQLYSDTQEDSTYLPMIQVDPVDITFHTIYAIPELTIFSDHVEYTHFIPKNIETIKFEMIETIQTEHEIDIENGFEIFGHIFDSNSIALLRITAVYTVANAIPEFEVDWIAKDNSIVHMTNEMIKGFALAAMQDQTIKIMTNRAKKDAVIACNTIEELLLLSA